MNTGHQIRQTFLDFFASRGHRVVKSSPLLPAGDPTLLFTNAGMNQFKDVFLGNEKRDYSRAATSQKCVRAGGKHNDLENVGFTRRHHTFFEMLGNFSFGDYFKAEAIEFAWDLITKDYSLPKDRLYVTVFREDDEAEQLWQKVAGVSKDRIFRLDEKDNFWQMGDTGPCGPCSEIHYDLGPDAAEPGLEHEQFPNDAGGRFVEIWNLVFMQYDRSSAGVLTPLPRPSIDTGMGLERVAAILQGKLSNYDCDLLAPIVSRAGELLHITQGENPKYDAALRIAADHARAAAFLIHDGIVPANDGRGYVLRKIMRRAMRHARRTGATDPFLYQLTGFVAEWMKPAYPELMESVDRVARIVKEEEHRYASTFHVAEKVFQDEIKSAANGIIPGAVAFKLYDTYGLALDEQEEMAREFNLSIDVAGFQSEMQGQRTRARASWKGAQKSNVDFAYTQLKSKFVGYEQLEADATINSFLPDKAEIVLDQTPFYAETGGQVGDRGFLFSGHDKVAEVLDTYYGVPGLAVHKVKPLAPIEPGMSVHAQVDAERRGATIRNHTATHLLHAALRQVLGIHVKQAGSVVDPGRLRFDFSHYTAVTPDELAEIERIANEQILRNNPVTTDVMDLESAVGSGAMALFGEKYADQVRVVSIGDFSKELCGGTHVSRTGDIGLCKVVYEGSISAGVRRIEAITGDGSLRKFQSSIGAVARVSELLRTSEPELIDQVERLLAQHKALEKQIEQMKDKLAQGAAGEMESQARTIKGVRVLSASVDSLDRAQMRTLADSLRNKWKSGVVVLASTAGGNIAIVSAVTKDLTAKIHAGKLAGALAQAVGGKGGGRPDMAEAGGTNLAALPEALQAVYTSVESML